MIRFLLALLFSVPLVAQNVQFVAPVGGTLMPSGAILLWFSPDPHAPTEFMRFLDPDNTTPAMAQIGVRVETWAVIDDRPCAGGEVQIHTGSGARGLTHSSWETVRPGFNVFGPALVFMSWREPDDYTPWFLAFRNPGCSPPAPPLVLMIVTIR